MIPYVALVLDTGLTPHAISRLRITLFVAPFPADTVDNQIAAVDAAVLPGVNGQVPAVEEIEPAGNGIAATLRTNTSGLHARRHRLLLRSA